MHGEGSTCWQSRKSKKIGRNIVGGSVIRKGSKKERPFQVHRFVLDHPREVLYDRINLRVDLMMQAGLEEEAKHQGGILSTHIVVPIPAVHTMADTQTSTDNNGVAKLPKTCVQCRAHRSTYLCSHCCKEVPLCHPNHGREGRQGLLAATGYIPVILAFKHGNTQETCSKSVTMELKIDFGF